MVELLSPKQIWLLSYENPLPKRFGKEFFKKIPEEPGVYWMLNDQGHILYIGKAKNLRNRLRSYRTVKPDQDSRKTIRLVHLIAEIRWEICASEKDALLRENYLLRTYRPPFNIVNTHPESYYFIGFRMREDGNKKKVDLGLTNKNPGEEKDFSPDELFGAYKGRGLIRSGYGALLRLLWVSLSPSSRLTRFEFPGVLVRRSPPPLYSIGMDPAMTEIECKEWEGEIKKFLKGTSKILLQKLTEKLLEKPDIPPFMYHYIQNSLETLAEFFTYGPHRNRRLRKFHGIKKHLLAQEEIDDLLVTSRVFL